jgi:hypothetical protein
VAHTPDPRESGGDCPTELIGNGPVAVEPQHALVLAEVAGGRLCQDSDWLRMSPPGRCSESPTIA